MRTTILLLGLLFFNPAFANSEVQAFVNKLIKLGHAYDPSIANYYVDDAFVHTLRIYPNGMTRELSFSGVQWKRLMVEAMPLAKARNDRSEYSNFQISQSGTRYKVKATRYSKLKCYSDSGYYMVLEKRTAGFVIVEEYMETRPDSNCR